MNHPTPTKKAPLNGSVSDFLKSQYRTQSLDKLGFFMSDTDRKLGILRDNIRFLLLTNAMMLMLLIMMVMCLLSQM